MMNEVSGIGRLRCLECGGTSFTPGDSRGAAGVPADYLLSCDSCLNTYSCFSGILSTSPPGDAALPVWDKVYSGTPKLDKSLGSKALAKGFSSRELIEECYSIIGLTRGLPVPLDSSLELGAGAGVFSLILKKLGLVREVTLLDYSIGALRWARSLFEYHGEECNLVHARFEAIPFERKAFSLVLSWGLIEHYRSEEDRLDCFLAHIDYGTYAVVQAPYDSPAYWFQKGVVTAMSGGWPFGYERPVTVEEMMLFSDLCGAELMGIGFQYLAGIAPLLYSRTRGLFQFIRTRGISSLATDIAVLVT
jgi:hypothetical protein